MSSPDQPLRGERWIVVCEEDVLPADTGCRVDHRGFLQATLACGIDTVAVVPGRNVVLADYERAFPGLHLLTIPRDERPVRHISPLPYVVASRPLPTDLGDRVATFGTPTAVVSFSVRCAHLGIALARRFDVSHLVRCQNLDSRYFGDLATGSTGPRKLAYRVEAAKLRRFEKRLNTSSDVTAFADVSSDEAAAHRTRTRHPVVHIPSFAVPPDGIPADAPVADARDGVLFLGSLDVETNQQALAWFLDEVWPTVRRAAPDTPLRVVGRRPTDDVRTRVAAAPGAELHADVPAIEPYLHASAVCVNPVRTGAGINVKLLDGIAGGCAAVSTTPGAGGLDWRDGHELLVADEPAAFAGAVTRLLSDADLRARLVTSGVAYLQDRLDPRRNTVRIADAMRRPSSTS